MVAVHNPGKTTNLVIRVVPCPRADISLAWFLTSAKSLASPTLAEIAMQANLCDRILLGRKGKYRRRACTSRSPRAPQAKNPNRRLSRRLPTLIPATRKTPHMLKTLRERNLYQLDTRAVIFAISFRYGS